ncbi:MAG: ABC transporter permease [Rhodospirillales bacterium]|nr:ABC transporter permease [Rhodospirillales bacterium]MDH3913638.1 ABC transporter permease [Rhodospirillales bacterium]MDH3920734.1 ABC transporter permease [Rhodospirillales bacterium]MDH3969915.1 ABC transporter permease [Rhodospirillales bacterium]
MDLSIVIENLPLYLQGLWLTVQLVVMALFFGMLLAIPIALLRTSKNPLVYGIPWAYIYFFRGTPLLVQLFMIYHGLGQFEVVQKSFLWPFLKEAYWCALLAFALNTAAYTAEILRGAIEQTAFGEVEAARACGMSRALMFRRIILPSAFRRALPAYGNEVIFMLHGSAIASVVTLVDLLGAGRIVNSRHFAPYESYLTAGLFYLGLTFLIVWGFKMWERRWHAHLRPRET